MGYVVNIKLHRIKGANIEQIASAVQGIVNSTTNMETHVNLTVPSVSPMTFRRNIDNTYGRMNNTAQKMIENQNKTRMNRMQRRK